ncbi:MAG: dTMP kinase [Coriobacteriales bacterium]|nr:dTMP kinase [Coriobacteriales bacterium]
MSTVIDINLPASKHDLAQLEPGQEVRLFGSIYTMRDAGHERALRYLDEHGVLPYDLAGQALFYAGPTQPTQGRPFAAIGPTTASRMDFAAPTLYEHGINLTLGKGRRSVDVARACAQTGSVYLVAVGGAAAYLASFVSHSELIAWEDLGPEALRRLTLTGLPAFVGIDSRGQTFPYASTCADNHSQCRRRASNWALSSTDTHTTNPPGGDDTSRAKSLLSADACATNPQPAQPIQPQPVQLIQPTQSVCQHPNNSGVLVTFEGGEGVGKSTQIRLLQARLEYAGYEAVCFREPGGTYIGEQVRQILLDASNTDMNALCELLLYEAARAQLVDEVIRPALQQGKVVLCDRFLDSTVAYQSFARGLPLDVVEAANTLGASGLLPDRTILLEQDVGQGLLKATQNGSDRLESEGLDFHHKVHRGFEILADRHPERIRRVPCQARKQDTATLVFAQLKDLFSSPRAREFTITPELLATVKELR